MATATEVEIRHVVSPASRTFDWRPLMRSVSPVLASARVAGRVYYRADCKPGVDNPVPMPRLVMQEAEDNASVLESVRRIFRDESRVVATMNSPEILRLRIGAVPDAILRTKLRLLKLTAEEQYNPDDAIGAIYGSKEMIAAARKYGIFQPVMMVDHIIAEPDGIAPHLPPTMTNVTIDQALDLIAKTFKGVVFYGMCTSTHVYDIGFAPFPRRPQG